jgi:Fe-S-cluster containining protein
VLKDASDGACIMLDGNRCRVYPVRPEKCRTFPYEWTNAESLSYCPLCRLLA